MSSARTCRNLRRAQLLTVPLGAGGYIAVQAIRDMDAGSAKDNANAGAAGAVAGLTIAANLVSLIDNLNLLYVYWSYERLSSKDKLGMMVGMMLSLGLIVYAGVNFLDQRHTGIVALANTAVLTFNSFFRRTAIDIDSEMAAKNKLHVAVFSPHAIK